MIGGKSRTLLLIMAAIYLLTPLLWLVRLSLTPEDLIHAWPPTLLPETFTFSHYADVLFNSPFFRQAGNSLVVCLVSTALALFCGALGAYGIARRRFRGREFLLTSLLALHLVPGVANMTAIYRMAGVLGAFDSLLFVALLKSGGVVMALWILTATFRRVPERLEQVAHLEGHSRAGVFFRVSLPLAAPGLMAAGLLLFIQAWNTFFLPFLLLEDPDKMTLTVGVYRYFSEHGFDKGHVAAFMVLALVPVAILFVLLHRKWGKQLAY